LLFDAIRYQNARNNWNTTSQKSQINPNVKVILMTAFEIKGNEFSKVFPSTQAYGFVQKPIHIENLTNKILT